jgi:hypothetical protein
MSLASMFRYTPWFACFRDANASLSFAEGGLNHLTFHSLRHPAVGLIKTTGISEGVVIELIGDESVGNK